MKKLRAILAAIIIGSLALTIASTFLPTPVGGKGPIATAISVFGATFSLGSSILFLMALKNFKPELRSAYRLMALSMLCLAIGSSLFPFLDFFGLWGNKIFNLLTYIPNMTGVILLYIGIRQFYTRVGLRGWPSKLVVLVPIILVLGILHTFVPVSPQGILPNFPTLVHDIWLLIPITGVVLYVAMTSMAFGLRRKTGQIYSKAFKWLGVGTLFFIWAVMTVVILDTFGYANWYFALGFTALAPNLSFVILLVTAYHFNAIAYPGQQVSWLRRHLGRRKGKVDSFDIITYASQLSANVDSIDPKLDVMRAISSTQSQEGAALSEADQTKLKDLYLTVERQLAEEDVLRDFQPAQLRADIEKHFALDQNAANTFWPMLKGQS